VNAFGHREYDIALIAHPVPAGGFGAIGLAIPNMPAEAGGFAVLAAAPPTANVFSWGLLESNPLSRPPGTAQIREFNANLLTVPGAGANGINDACCVTKSRTGTAEQVIAAASVTQYAGPCIGDDGAGLIVTLNAPIGRRLIAISQYSQGCGSSMRAISGYTYLGHQRINSWITGMTALPAGFPAIALTVATLNALIPAVPVVPEVTCVGNIVGFAFTTCRLDSYPAQNPVLNAGNLQGWGGSDNCENAPWIPSGTNFVQFNGATASPNALTLAQCGAVDANNNAPPIEDRTSDKWFRILVPAGATRVVVDACQILGDGVDTATTAFLDATGSRAGAVANTRSRDVLLAVYDGNTLYNPANGATCSSNAGAAPQRCSRGNSYITAGTHGVCDSGRGVTLHVDFSSITVFAPRTLAIRIGVRAADAVLGNSGNFFVQFYNSPAGAPQGQAGGNPAVVAAVRGGCSAAPCPSGQTCQADNTCSQPTSVNSVVVCNNWLPVPIDPAVNIRSVFRCVITANNALGPILADQADFIVTVANGRWAYQTANRPQTVHAFLVFSDSDGIVGPIVQVGVRIRTNNQDVVNSPFNVIPPASVFRPCNTGVLAVGEVCSPGATSAGVGFVCACGGAAQCLLNAVTLINECRIDTTCPANPPALLTPANAIAAVYVVPVVSGIPAGPPPCSYVGPIEFAASSNSFFRYNLPAPVAPPLLTYNQLTLTAKNEVQIMSPAIIGIAGAQGLIWKGTGFSTLYACQVAIIGTTDFTLLTGPAAYAPFRQGCAIATARIVFNGNVVGLTTSFTIRGPVSFSGDLGSGAVPVTGIINVYQDTTQTSFLSGNAFGSDTGYIAITQGAFQIQDVAATRSLRTIINLGLTTPPTPPAGILSSTVECLLACGTAGHFEIRRGCLAVRLDCGIQPNFGPIGLSLIALDQTLVVSSLGQRIQDATKIPRVQGTLVLPPSNRFFIHINAVAPVDIAANDKFILIEADNLVIDGNIINPANLAAVGVSFGPNAARLTGATVAVEAGPLGANTRLVLTITAITALPADTVPPSPSPLSPSFVYNFGNLADISRSSAVSTSPLSVLFITLISLCAAYLIH
jgi:hypothetical protein